MKEIEIEKDFAVVQIHISELDLIANYFALQADKEAAKGKGFFTRDAADYNRIAQASSSIADRMRKKIRKNEDGSF